MVEYPRIVEDLVIAGASDLLVNLPFQSKYLEMFLNYEGVISVNVLAMNRIHASRG
jgi:hypothetical protein